jgi:hypothetical protein
MEELSGRPIIDTVNNSNKTPLDYGVVNKGASDCGEKNRLSPVVGVTPR